MNAYQSILQKTFERKVPFAAHFELTYRCNLSCVHCYTRQSVGKTELSTDEACDVLEQLAEMNCLFLTFTGGEIMRRKDFPAILSKAAELGFALSLFTSGTLMTKETVDLIAAAKPVSVEFSLYAVRPAIHDGITGVAGSHARTLAAIEMCRSRGLNVKIKTMLMKLNVREYDALRAFAEKAGVRFVVDFVLAAADDGSKPMERHGLTEDELFDFLVVNSDPAGGAPSRPAMSDPVCGAGSNTICIAPNGDVYPCLAIREAVGNVRSLRLKRIWKSPALDNVRGMRYCVLKDCASCAHLAHCQPCIGLALADCGRLTGSSEAACRLARATARAIRARTEGEARPSAASKRIQPQKAQEEGWPPRRSRGKQEGAKKRKKV